MKFCRGGTGLCDRKGTPSWMRRSEFPRVSGRKFGCESGASDLNRLATFAIEERICQGESGTPSRQPARRGAMQV